MKQHMGFALFSLTGNIRRAINESLARHAINAVQARILGILTHHPQPVCQRDIEEVFHCSRSNISGVLDTMEKNGLIRREDDLTDKRRKNLILTKTGMDISSLCEEVLDEIDDVLCNTLTDEEQQAISEMFGKMTGALERYEQDSLEKRS